MAKSHLVIQVGGRTKRLITAHEDSQGRVFLVPHVRGQFQSDDVTEARLTQFKYSLHLSPRSRSNAVTSHGTMRFSDGTERHAYLFTHAVNNGTFQPLEHRTFTAVEEDDNFVVPAHDGIHDLGSY